MAFFSASASRSSIQDALRKRFAGLIAERLAIPGDIRKRHAEQIAASLDEVIGEVHGRVISAYWPFRGEPDLRGFMAGAAEDNVLSLWS